jgi:hypothetical protein
MKDSCIARTLKVMPSLFDELLRTQNITGKHRYREQHFISSYILSNLTEAATRREVLSSQLNDLTTLAETPITAGTPLCPKSRK